MEFGQVHHIEYYVNDLASSTEFWGWFLLEMGYKKFQEWPEGISWAHASGTYLVFVQVSGAHLAVKNNRQANGLNHIAFQGKSKAHVAALEHGLLERGREITFRDDSQICFIDPNEFAVEVYIP